MSKLISCKTGEPKVTYEVSFFTNQQVKNCYYFKDKYFFFFCENYCENFHLSKADGLFDGELVQLKKFVDLIMKTKHEVFDYPSNNVLMWTVTYEEDLLKRNYEIVFNESIFFKGSNTVKLDSFVTDVVYWGGMDPWESCEQSLYEISIAFEQILGSLVSLAVILFL